MNREKEKKKVLFISLLIFLISGGGIFVFFIFQGIEDLKDKPGFEFEYNTAAKKALLPILKYVGIVDSEVLSVGKEIPVSENSKSIVLKDLTEENKDNTFQENDSKNFSSTKNSNRNYNTPYYSPNKLSSNLSGGGNFSSGGGSSTSGTLSKFSSGSINKEINISANSLNNSKMNENAKNLLARLQATRSTLAEAYKSGSAQDAKYKWDKSFVGSSAGGHSMMFSNSGGAVKLDKIDAAVGDLKITDTKGLTAPTPDKPTVDKDATNKNNQSDPVKKAMEEMTKSVLEGLGNSLVGSAVNNNKANSNTTGSTESNQSDPLSNQEVLKQVKNLELKTDSKITLTYNSITNEYFVHFEGKDWTGNYADYAILDKNGNVKEIVYKNIH